MKIVENYLLYIISFVAFGNLYYVAPLIGISHNVFLFIFLVITFVFSAKYYLRYRKTYYNRFFSMFFIISSLLIPLNIYNDYIFRPNDMIRVFWFICVFNWIREFYKNRFDLSIFLKRISYLLFALFIILSIFEHNSPVFFQTIVYGGEIEEVSLIGRLAVTFRDANVYSAVICFFLYILLRTEKSFFLQLLMLAVSAIIVNLTGSRMGGMVFVIISTWWVVNQSKRKALFFIIILSSVLYLQMGSILESSINEKESLISRITGTTDSGEKSSKGREDSLIDGVTFGLGDNLWNPAGNFYFDYKWRHTTNHGYHFPHSGFVYLLCEYGIFCLLVLFLFFKLFLFAIKKKELILFVVAIAPVLFLPNSLYIFPLYFGSFLIEYKPFK